MANTLAVAKYLNSLFYDKHGANMDQMKMHKMMYFTFRESMMINKKPLFDESFEAWKYGPVLTNVRSEYQSGNMFANENTVLDNKEEELVRSVFNHYDEYSAWDLSTLSHAEVSWKQARNGLKATDQGHNKLSLSAIKVDATREFLRRKGVVLD